jgi:integrase
MSIRKRGPRWLVTVELGADHRGVRRRKCVTCDSEMEAKRTHAELPAEVLSGTYLEPSIETLADFLTEWLMHAGRDRAATTLTLYRIIVETHLIPALGRVKLADLRPLHVERFITAQRAAGLAPSTVAKHFWTLHKALDRAVAWGKLTRNPAAAVERPSPGQASVRALDVEEQARLLGAASGTPWYGPLLVALATGMRRGEIVALRWADVDTTAGAIAVHGTKSAAARRRVRIPESLSAFLTEHRAKQRQLYAAVSGYAERGYVFCAEDGSPLRADSLTAAFARLARKLNLPDAHFHCLRHTFATEMLGAGVLVKVVSEMLGHASAATTLRIYAHVLADMQEAAALQAGAILEAARRLER